MAVSRKPDTSQLRIILTCRTIDNFKTAEEVGDAFLSLSYNRNLLVARDTIRRYVAASVYLLAHMTPVPVVNSEGRTLYYRSRTGDMAHLLILLSYSPQMVFALMQCNERTVWKGNPDEDAAKLKQFTAHINKLIVDGAVLHFCDDAFVFHVGRWAASPMAKPARETDFAFKDMTAKAVLVKCNFDIRMIFDDNGEYPAFTLEKLGARFMALRNSLNLYQKNIAENIGISRTAYLHMEAGSKISAEVLFKCLLYYSKFVNIDVLFDNRLWGLAKQDQDLLFKKIHIGSVVHRKHQMLKENLINDLQDTQKILNENIEKVLYEFETGINSILTLTEE